ACSAAPRCSTVSAMAIEELLARRLSGKPLTLVARAVRNPSIASVGAEVLRRELGVDELEALCTAEDVLETDLSPRAGRAPREPSQPLDAPVAASWAVTSDALTAAY